MDEENAFMTVDEVAVYLRLPASTVYHLAQTKVLPSFKVGKHWRFKKRSIDEWIDKQEQDRSLNLEDQPPDGP